MINYLPLTTQEGSQVLIYCLVGKGKERKLNMFVMKQDKSLKLSDNRQHLSFCSIKSECRQLSYLENSASAGSRTF